jgi:hypothetical protein
MQQPARVDLFGDRYVPLLTTITVLEQDFTGATFNMQVRDRKDGGALRADLDTVANLTLEGVCIVYAGTDTVTAHIAAGRMTQEDATDLGLAGGDSVAVSVLGIRVNEATMEAMPFGDEIGDDKVLFYDMHISPSGGTNDVWIAGTITVRAGVTV